MELVSSWYKSTKVLPEGYIFPPEKRPDNLPVRCHTIPVIDLKQGEGHNQADVVQQIMKASQEFGFFQVINHGIPENQMNECMELLKEIFEMPAEEKAKFVAEQSEKACRLGTSTAEYSREKIHYWRDHWQHPCHPLDECIQLWPEKPARYREVVAAYSNEAKSLGLRILELVCEGLGLEHGYFGGKLSEAVSLLVNYYPPCPDPSLTLGLASHCDPNLLTILHQQGDVSGLQVLKDEGWIPVEPLHNAIVVNIGYQLQIISNNKMKSAEHRVVTNTTASRTSVAYVISPSDDCIIEPAKSFIDASNAPIYRAFEYKEFLRNFYSMMGEDKMVLEPFKLKGN